MAQHRIAHGTTGDIGGFQNGHAVTEQGAHRPGEAGHLKLSNQGARQGHREGTHIEPVAALGRREPFSNQAHAAPYHDRHQPPPSGYHVTQRDNDGGEHG